MENEENNYLEKTNSKQNDSYENINNINIENDKKEIIENITPKITEIISQKDNLNNNFNENDSIQKVTKEEYQNYREKKLKLYNFYQTLLNFRQKLIIKEKHLNQREKNLLEFEKILQANESILKNNIEQFESYMRTKIAEIKPQFNQIEQLQQNKELYLNQREKEIKREKSCKNILFNKNINVKRCMNCNCPLISEEELNRQFISNNYCNSCNNYLNNIFNQKSKTINNMPINNNIFSQEQNLEESNQTQTNERNFGGLFNKFNDFNYKCCCPSCNFCNI
jgi:hypothetical protein